MPENNLPQQLVNNLPWLAALIGGVLDYLNELRKGSKSWSLFGFAVHLASAVFFGWVLYSIAGQFGYGGDASGAIAGFGGFLGTRTADIVIALAPKVRGK